MMSVPDEPSHAIKAAAVARGQLTGTPNDVPGQSVVTVPEWVAEGHELTCSAFQPEVTPNCATIDIADSSRDTRTVTTAGNYNPIYYAVVGSASLIADGYLGLYAMRLMSALVSCIFLAAMFTAISQLRNHRWLIVAAATSVTPMVLYLNGSVNPNSLEFATTGAVFANLLLLLEKNGTPRVHPQTVIWITLGASMLANTKALSLLWLLIAVVTAFGIAGVSQIRQLLKSAWFWSGTAVIGIACGFALWWVATAGSLESPTFAGVGSSYLQGLQTMFDRTFDYANGLIGYFGWLDTPAPAGVLAFWAFLVGALIVTALALGSGRARWGLIFAIACFVVLPPILQAAVVTEQGYIWQGRYILALFVIVILSAGATLDRRFAGVGNSWEPNRLGAWIAVLATIAHAYAYIWVLRRYVIGLSDTAYWQDMFRVPAWQPPFGWVTWALIYVVVASCASLLIYRLVRGDESPPDMRPARKDVQEVT